jgi:hypothetical protein
MKEWDHGASLCSCIGSESTKNCMEYGSKHSEATGTGKRVVHLWCLKFNNTVCCNITHCLICSSAWIISYAAGGDLTLIAAALSCLMSLLAILSRMSSMITGFNLPFTNTLLKHQLRSSMKYLDPHTRI